MLVMRSNFVHTSSHLDAYHHTGHYCILGYSLVLSQARKKEAETVLYSTSVGIVVAENHRHNPLSASVLGFLGR